ncbi:hemolysin family protein [Paractinoplanes atraurantiacus]|uniref:Hemolysin, contains CBS domains n=1 Tax=Paractinoplanes atraurantiacus TaxID=1036182 RepID=A0A285JSJ8_9ACTN|nr:hemolysin family protein [Actinoplanes atraurantiacus]SNY63282.1 Hemolysin, contains CBS domains [Actinoplanes atraurantiacus]
MDGLFLTAVLPLAAFALLTAGNAFFVAAEFGLVTVDRPEIDARARSGDRRARTVQHALHELSFQLSGTQLGITITALLTGYLAEPALSKIFTPLIEPIGGDATEGITHAIALVVATLVSMLFGELVPKNAALARPMRAALLTAAPLRTFSKLFKYLIGALNGSANWLVRRIGVEPQEELASARSPEELGLLAAISARAGTLPNETATLVRRTIRFGEKRAASAMTPRVDVVGLTVGASVADLITKARETGHTRFPVYENTIDLVTGVVAVPDALGVPPERRAATRVSTIAREPVYVPESLGLDKVLSALREAGADLAIVVDEYGGTDGVVSVEDLIEELVGEIADEYDAEQAETSTVELTAPGGEKTFLVDGLLREDELIEQTGFKLPEGPYETLAGFLLARLGHIPEVGESYETGGWEFTIMAVDRHRVEQVRVVIPPEPADD